MDIKGVNLGNWLVLDKWMHDVLDGGTVPMVAGAALNKAENPCRYIFA